MKTVNRLADRLLSRLVPHHVAAAACRPPIGHSCDSDPCVVYKCFDGNSAASCRGKGKYRKSYHSGGPGYPPWCTAWQFVGCC